MKKILCSFLVILMALGVFMSIPLAELPLGVTAEAASTSDLKFRLNDDGKSYEVDDCETSASGSLTIPSTYNGKPVTSIAFSAFKGCENLTSITIPGSIKEIINGYFYDDYYEDDEDFLWGFYEAKMYSSYDDFDDSDDYDYAYFEEGDYGVFTGCKSLTSVTFGEGLTTLGDLAFYNCQKLKSVKLPSTLKTIGERAFDSCEGLTSITIPNSVTSIGDWAFRGCEGLKSITIPSKVTLIGKGTFYYCTGLTSVTIPNSVTEIGEDAFDGCKGLTSITIPSKVTLIGKGAFSCCTGLKSITIPNSVTSIGDWAFSNCDNLKSVTIPNSVTEIGDSAFSSCYNLKSVYITNLEKWLNIDFSDENSNPCSYADDFYVNGKIVTNLVIPNKVKRIKPYAFYNNQKITSITIPSSVTSIGKDAFYGTGYYNKSSNWKGDFLYIGTNLVNVKGNLKSSYTVKDGTTLIADFVFYDEGYWWGDDISFKVISVPKSVKYIGEAAFGYYGVEFERGDGDLFIDATAIPGFTVYGISGSVAQTYAKNNGFKFVNVTKPGTVKLSAATNTSTGVKVSWSKIDNSSTYTVYRKSGNSGWSALKREVVGTSYTDTTAKSGTKYTYTVRATNVAGTGGYDKTGKTTLFLATPKLSSVANSTSGVTVKWGKVTGAKEYYVYRKSGNSGWKKIGTSKGTSYTDKTAKSGTSYTYTVRAYNGKTSSAYNTKGLTIKFLATPKLSSVTSAKSGVTLKWGKVTGASGYYVYRKTGNGSWKRIATVKGNSKVSYLDKSAKKGTTYTYTVRAYNGKTLSAYNTKGLKIKDKY